MAHIERRGPGRWRARYRGPDNRERSKTFTTKRDAQQWLDGVEVSKARGLWVDPARGRQTFEAYVEAWLLGRGHITPGTRLKEVGHVHNHLLPAFGSWRLSAIHPTDVRAWLATLECSPGTTQAIFGTLRMVLRTAVNDGILGRCPTDGLDLPRITATEEMVILKPAQIEALAQAIEPRYRALIFVAGYGGLRYGEIAALRPENFNLLRGVVTVRSSLSDVSGKIRVQPPKSGKVRTVSLPRTVCEMIGQHMSEFPSENGVVFSAPEGGYLRRSIWYRRAFKPAVLAAGLDERLRFHDLRHTSVALAIAQGAHPKAIQERLGHSSIRLTLDRYGHLFPSLDETMQEGLERVLLEASAASPRPGASNVLILETGKRPG